MCIPSCDGSDEIVSYFTLQFSIFTNYFIVLLVQSILLKCQRKMFSRSSRQPIRTVTTGYALSSMFVPGDKHAIVGTKVQLHEQQEALR